jgi:hypothetical protein
MPKEQSPFAAAIAAILDPSLTCSKKEWAERLQVSTAALSQWINDQSIPRPETLNALLEIARTFPKAAEAVKRFQAVLDLPVHEVTQRMKTERSRLEKRSVSCLGDYMLEPKFDRFLATYSRLSPKGREAALSLALTVAEPPALSQPPVVSPDPLDHLLVRQLFPRLRDPSERVKALKELGIEAN